jgi:hypothetical protein
MNLHDLSPSLLPSPVSHRKSVMGKTASFKKKNFARKHGNPKGGWCRLVRGGGGGHPSPHPLMPFVFGWNRTPDCLNF